jgi:hypothetical protein
MAKTVKIEVCEPEPRPSESLPKICTGRATEDGIRDIIDSPNTDTVRRQYRW